jgi:hypothetical protein
VNHIQNPKNDSMCGTEKVAHILDYRKITKKKVIVDVGSVRNAPHELRFSSLDLQEHNLNLNRVNKK